ncbi:hypothetical protein HPB50_008541 [Hyalomma asiaticum]|uniref:Uncharacterized protein n=1 Tax=Hyalomma asiaticum TaxID=266040 RepID=A0ACB7SF11_HYAAI|nr:hypothetical protein HPB50_008541 [Hyalomma asiaticum]
MVEFWWGSYLANVRSQQNKKEDKERGASQVLVLGENVELPDNIYSLLKKGPKFSLEPVVQPHELLAFNRRVANRAPQEQHDRCLLEGVDALLAPTVRSSTFRSTTYTPGEGAVKRFQHRGLLLTIAEKRLDVAHRQRYRHVTEDEVKGSEPFELYFVVCARGLGISSSVLALELFVVRSAMIRGSKQNFNG